MIKRVNIQNIQILIFALAIHIYTVNCKLLFSLNEETAKDFPLINEPSALALIFAFPYSLATVSVLRATKSKPLIVIFAVMDAFGVLIQYYPDMESDKKAVYFAIYTGLLIISTIFLDKPEYLSDLILEMKQKGISQRDIAQELNISESMVSRIIKRTQEATE